MSVVVGTTVNMSIEVPGVPFNTFTTSLPVIAYEGTSTTSVSIAKDALDRVSSIKSSATT